MNGDEARTALLALREQVPDELLNFARAMYAADDGPAIDGWVYFLTRPEKWGGEYLLWVQHERPQESGDTWPAFMAAIEALDHARF
jgi:hypothetical protein